MAGRLAAVEAIEPPSDPTILAELQAGDAGAAALLYDRFGSEIHRIVWRIIGADQDHNDLVQQVFCVILERIGTVREAASLPWWIRRVTVNVTLTELRRRRLGRLRWAHGASPDQFVTVDPDPVSRQTLREIYDVLRRMPAKLQVVFVLRNIEGYTFAELAHALGCSLRTAKRRVPQANGAFERLARAHPALQQRFREGTSPRGR